MSHPAGGRARRAPRRSIGRCFARLARGLALALLVVAVAEATVRIGAETLPGVRMLAEPRGARVNDPETFAEFQRAYRDVLVPNEPFYDFPRNSLGFHDREFRREKPAGMLRIVALGDSFTYGSVPFSHSYVALAEALLVAARDRGDGTIPVEIDNLGVPASGITDYRLVYSFVGRALQPDVVLVTIYLGNDPRDFVDPVHFGPERDWPASYLVTFAQRAWRLYREGQRREVVADEAPPGPAPGRGTERRPGVSYDDSVGTFAEPSFSDEAFAPIQRGELEMLARAGAGTLHAPDWDGFRRALAKLVDDVERDGARVVLALAPSRLQVHPEELRAVAAREEVPLSDVDPLRPNRIVAAFARERGVPAIDLTPALREAAGAGGRLYRPNDTHWSLRGNTLAAAALARGLVALDLAERAPPDA